MVSKLGALILLPLVVYAEPYTQEKLYCMKGNVFALVDDHAAAYDFCGGHISFPTKTITRTILVGPTCPAETITLTSTPSTNFQIIDGIAISTQTTVSTTTQVNTKTITRTKPTTTLTCLNGAYTATLSHAIANKHYGLKAPSHPKNLMGRDDKGASQACECMLPKNEIETVKQYVTLKPRTKTITVNPVMQATEKATATVQKTVTNVETTTSTTTMTAHIIPTAITPNGLLYRKYEHNYNAYLVDTGFNSTFFKGKSTDRTGTLRNLSFSSTGSRLILHDNSPAFDVRQTALVFNGFFIAKETGSYMFSSSGRLINNWGYLWVGSTAYSAWNDDNAAFKASRTGAGKLDGTVSIKMNKGDAIPLTWLWANGGGTGMSDFTITSPSGASTKDGAGYFVKACSDNIFV